MDMNMKQVNAIGDVCPLPVIKTKKALGEMPSGQLEVLVDNEIAVRNIEKYIHSTGCGFQFSKQGEHYVIHIEKGEDQQRPEVPVSASEGKPYNTDVFGGTVVVIASEKMGRGDDELGGILMKGFVFALTQLDILPDTVLLYNSGARLSIQGSTSLDDLIALEKAGVKVKTCGTCLNHFGITDQLGVGEVTNMYSIVEEMQHAGRTLRP